MFEQAYHSVYHHPLIMWAVGIAVLGALIARGAHRWGFVGAWLILFQLEIATDAWMTGGLKPFAPDGTLATVTAVAFVIIGDLRYFILLERYSHREGAKPLRWLALPIAYAFAIPILSQVAAQLWPGNMRALFLTYELMFFTLAIGIRTLLLPRRAETAPARHIAFVRTLTTFEIVQYGLWATADIVILSGADAGYLLRFVPNLMYYTALVPFVWLVAPPDLTR